ncbi:HBR066Cp [Eremothecium sinecaudum]|uniref:HBR066Cp n=1 Tax=Eremothecium sinecaudum TaxID=45286 RepID=A0A109UXI9_9SACH|nr:HBR066Cp [Eremothecium sinecaudum]AMD18967.1 HBR066Cp [Eremothecium sinecaudum]
MVKSYQRFEQGKVFGVISSNTNCIWLPSHGSKNSPGQIITGSLENVNLWEIKTGELLKHLSDGIPPGSIDAETSKPPESTYLEYHTETNLLAVGYANGVIKVWDMQTLTVLIIFNSHTSAITYLKFDPTGTTLISGSRDSNIIIWDLVGEVGLCKLRSHKDAITGIWCEGNEWLLSTSKDGLVKIWDLKTQQCVETHMAHAGECWSLAVKDDLVITANSDSELKIWELDLGRENGNKLLEKGTYEKQSKHRTNCIKFITVPDSTSFFYVQNSDKTTEIFRIRPEAEISKAIKKRVKRLQEKGMTEIEVEETIRSSHQNIIMHPFIVLRSMFKIKAAAWAHCTSSKLEMVLTTSNNTIEYYSIPYKKREPTVPVGTKLYTIDLQGHRTDIRSIDISDDNKMLLTSSNGLMKVWNIKTQRCIRTFECGYALCCKFLPGGTFAVIGTRAGELQLFDLASSTLVQNIESAHSAAIWGLDITSDGKRLVTGSADKSVKFWDFNIDQVLMAKATDKYTSTLELIHDTTLELGEDILSVKISPEDKFLAVALLDNTVKVFFLDSMKFFLSLYGHKLPVLSMDISYDSKMIITSSADKNIKIWGLDFGDCHKSLFAHQDSIMNVVFVPGTHNFFSCSKDGTVKYWDGEKFECIQNLAAHQSEVWSLAASSNGQFFVSASHDRSIRIWEETDDQVFLEEEKEKELNEQYEQNLLNSLEDGSADDQFNKGEEQDVLESAAVHKQTIESLKASEKLMEALDLGIKEIEAHEEYEKHIKKWKAISADQPQKPQANAILVAVNKSPAEYVLDTLTRIKPSQVEDALLVFPFTYVLKFLKFIDVAIKDKNILNDNLALIFKNFLFIIKANYKELLSQKNESLKLQINNVKDELRKALRNNADVLGFNLQGLKFISQQWNINHNSKYIDEYDQLEHEKKTAKKRVFQATT